MPKKPKYNIDQNVLYDLYVNQNKSLVDIATIYNVNYNVITYNLIKYGIPIKQRRFEQIETGTKFGRLTFLNFVRKQVKENKPVVLFAHCICECGKECDIKFGSLYYKKTQSCGCLAIDRLCTEKYMDVNGTFWSRLKTRSRRDCIELTITPEYTWNVFVKQNKKCVYTGVDLVIPKFRRNNDGNASLDRIDSSIGYVENNVQWIDKRVQFMKYIYTDQEFKQLCYQITDYTRERN